MSDYDLLPTVFRLDKINGCLWQGPRIIRLHPKSWAVLQYLVAKRGQRVSLADLHTAAWPGKRVSEANVKVQIRYLRKVLHDSSKQSQFIATHRGGYSFTAHVHQLAAGVHSLGIIASLSRPPSPAHLLGRDDPLDDLYMHLNKALASQRQVVFVSGEPAWARLRGYVHCKTSSPICQSWSRQGNVANIMEQNQERRMPPCSMP